MTTIRLSNIVARPFWNVHQDIKRHGHTYYWLKGGRGSTKSSYISIEIPQLLIQHPDCHAVILRKVGNTIKNSVYPQIQWGIEQLGLIDKFKYKTSPHEITYKQTGQKILFFGCDDPQKIKSIKLPFGYIGIVWMEELDQFGGMEEIRNLNQSLLRGGPLYWEFCSYNPPKSMDSWVNGESLIDDSDRLVHHSDYREVPRDWLGDEFITEAEKLKARNETLYRHEYLGEVTGTGGAVFDNVATCRYDEIKDSLERPLYGLDFGFAIDPLAFLEMYYDRRNEDLYIVSEIYQTHLSNKKAYNLISKVTANRLIYADREPRTIAELRRLGLNVYGAKKGPDSIDYGISWLQSRNHIYIDKERCPNAYREFATYEYQRDKQGNFISAYPDKNNHAIDAARYGCQDVMPINGTMRILK